MWPLDQQGPFEAFVALMVAVYTAAAYTSGGEAVATGVVTTVGLLVGVFTGAVGGESAGNVIPFTVWVVVAYVIGRVFRRRHSSPQNWATASPDSSASASSKPDRLWLRSGSESHANSTTSSPTASA